MTINGAHWGMFHPRLDGDRVTDVEPFERDAAPADLIYGIPAAVHAANRVRRPAIRTGWLEGKPTGRGADGYVSVSWSTALDRIEHELRRVRKSYGFLRARTDGDPPGVFIMRKRSSNAS
jgi:biotin/methionine sulfoxide reductase